jgi:hypothetical protein
MPSSSVVPAEANTIIRTAASSDSLCQRHAAFGRTGSIAAAQRNHQQDERRYEENLHRELREASARTVIDECEDAPGRHVIHGGAGDHRIADARLLQTPLREMRASTGMP